MKPQPIKYPPPLTQHPPLPKFYSLFFIIPLLVIMCPQEGESSLSPFVIFMFLFATQEQQHLIILPFLTPLTLL